MQKKKRRERHPHGILRETFEKSQSNKHWLSERDREESRRAEEPRTKSSRDRQEGQESGLTEAARWKHPSEPQCVCACVCVVSSCGMQAQFFSLLYLYSKGVGRPDIAAFTFRSPPLPPSPSSLCCSAVRKKHQDDDTSALLPCCQRYFYISAGTI